MTDPDPNPHLDGPADAPAGTAPPSALRSRADFESALRWSLGHALVERSRRLIWLDPDFAHWPLGDPAILDALTQWLRLPQRRLVLVAHQYTAVERLHSRFVTWRRPWSHAVEAWSPSEGTEVRLPTLALDDGRLCLQMFDTTQWRGRLSLDERAARQWRDDIEVLLQRCEAAFPAHPLGL